MLNWLMTTTNNKWNLIDNNNELVIHDDKLIDNNYNNYKFIDNDNQI